MLIRYGGPKLQMDFVSFVLLMLRAEKTESELLGSREGGASSALFMDFPPAPSSGRIPGEQLLVQKWQERWLCACESRLHLPTLTCSLPSPEAEV